MVSRAICNLAMVVFMAFSAMLFFDNALVSNAKAQARRVPPGYPVDTVRAVIMVRTALIALNNANLTGNYTVLRALGAPGFQLANTPAKLAEAFSNLRKRKIDLAPVVVINPVFTRKPFVNRQGMLVLTGYFPSQPEAVIFTLGYKPVAGIWKLNYISVNTRKITVQNKGGGKPKATKAKTQKKSKKKSSKKRRKSSSLNMKVPYPKPRPRRTEKGDMIRKM